jgi:hypothetical protein
MMRRLPLPIRSILHAIAVAACGACGACGPTHRDPSGAEAGGHGSSSSASTGQGSVSTSTSDAPNDTAPSSSESASTGEPPLPINMCLNNYPEQDCDVDWAVRNGQACNWWVDDCGPDSACVIDLDGEASCLALGVNPGARGDPCAKSNPCGKGLLCGIDGYCLERCTCSDAHPHCPDPNSTCFNITESREPAYCLPSCDPVAQDCAAPGVSCWSWNIPICENPPYLAVGVAGDPCGNSFNVECVPGLECTAGAPQCDYSECCAPLCYMDDPEACAEFGADFTCGQLGVSQDPECYQGIGVCRSS